MIQLDAGRSAAVFVEYRLKPSEQAAACQLPLLGPVRQPRPKFRIGYTVASDSFGVFLPRHNSIPETSCVYRVALNDEVTVGIEVWDIQGLPSCRVEAMAMPPGEDADATPCVVALLRL
jgi:hypothetical protein